MYQQDFISKQSLFIHPYKSFGMGKDASSKKLDFVSTLIDPNAVQDIVYMASVDDAFKTGTEPDLTIKDEDMELKDIIAQYDQPDDGKSGKNQKKPRV